jgi:PIN domain nuclease of toxin-antitoxin system
MSLLLDTYAFLWFVWNDPRLSVTAMSLITDPANELFLSVGTLLEVAVKVSVKKLKLSEPYETFMQREITNAKLTIVPLTMKHAATMTSLPLHHRDPFDRLLIAQSMVENLPLVSADSAFDAYPITRLW